MNEFTELRKLREQIPKDQPDPLREIIHRLRRQAAAAAVTVAEPSVGIAKDYR